MRLAIAVAAACAGLVLLPTTALPASQVYSAQTSAPVKKQGFVSAAGVQWNCGGNRCTTTGPRPTLDVKACHALAQQVGRISAFGHAKKRFGFAELNQCNAGIAVSLPRMAVPPPRIMTPIAPPRPSIGTMPASPTPKPAPAPSPAPQTKVTTRSGPATFTTLPLTVTGTGALSSRGPFGPRSLTTLEMTVTGTGALAERGPFTPKTFTTEGLTVTGTGALN